MKPSHLKPLQAAIAATFVIGSLTSQVACADRMAEPATQPAELTTQAAVTVRAIEWNGWDAFELRSPATNAVVVPAIGRVMHFGKNDAGADGNVLWRDPALDGVMPDPSANWQNFGGDKAWPWPQPGEEGWVRLQESGDWPPPIPFRGTQWKADVEGQSVELRLADVVDKLDVRVLRRIEMLDDGSLLVETSFKQANTIAAPLPFGVWHVTQIPLRQATVVAMGDPKMSLEPKWMADEEFATSLGEFVTPLPDLMERQVVAVTPLEHAGKTGMVATVLAAGMSMPSGDVLFIQQVVAADGDRDLSPSDRAQVFTMPMGDGTGDLGPWTELEFAAPIGKGSRLAVRWRLEDLDGRAADDPVAVAERVAELVP